MAKPGLLLRSQPPSPTALLSQAGGHWPRPPGLACAYFPRLTRNCSLLQDFAAVVMSSIGPFSLSPAVATWHCDALGTRHSWEKHFMGSEQSLLISTAPPLKSSVALKGSCHLHTVSPALKNKNSTFLKTQKYHGEITYINMNIIKSSS